MRIFIWKNGRVSAQTKASLCTVDQTILLLLSAQLFRFNYLSRYFFLLPCVDFCFPIVPMRISILCRYQKILGSKSTWHSLELLPQMILFIIMFAPPPLRMIPLIIQATLFISFTSFYYGWWKSTCFVPQRHRYHPRFYFFDRNKRRMASLISYPPFFFFVQCLMGDHCVSDKSFLVLILICRLRYFLFLFGKIFCWQESEVNLDDES